MSETKTEEINYYIRLEKEVDDPFGESRDKYLSKGLQPQRQWLPIFEHELTAEEIIEVMKVIIQMRKIPK